VTRLEAATPLFARADFRRVAGETLRPGGVVLTRRAVEACRLAPGDITLDLGCGPGATARLLAHRGCRVIALDLDPAFAASAARTDAEPVAAVVARAEALPLRSASIDAVFCECVLSLSPNPQAMLTEAARVLRPGGTLVLTDLYLRTATGAAAPAPGCAAGARPWEQTAGLLDAAGFDVAIFEDHSRLLAELAGRLIFSGVPLTGLAGCGNPGAKPGYHLCLAHKRAAQGAPQ
jgi:SAM-dependent methyltransferase